MQTGAVCPSVPNRLTSLDEGGKSLFKQSKSTGSFTMLSHALVHTVREIFAPM